MENETKAGKVLVVSATDSFLAKSLMSKLENAGIFSVFSHAKIKEVEEHAESTELMILFLSEDIIESTETIVYLKDLVQDKQMGFIVIGEPSEYEKVSGLIPEQAISKWFERPIDIDVLMKTVSSYLDENTGEKRRKTVLIVDDDITYMRTVYEWLKSKYRVGMASNGVQAISFLAKTKADLVLLDYEMPVANGPQVLSMLKNDSETEQIPVMFLTGRGDKDSVLSVVGLCPVDYLLKTIDKDTLLNKLDNFFKAQKKS